MAFNTGFSRVSITEGTFSTLFTLLVIAIAWTGWLSYRGEATDFQATIVSFDLLYRPVWLIEAIRAGGPWATFLCTLVIMVHVFCVVMALALASYIGMRVYDGLTVGRITWRTRVPFITFAASPRSERRINAGMTPSGRDLVRIEQNKVAVVIETADRQTYRNVFPEYFIRMRRGRLALKRKPGSPIERLEVAVMEMLVAHRDWPADPDGHHSDKTLIDHSMEVTQRLIRALPTEPLSRVVGLSHDIGKLIAYEPVIAPNTQGVRVPQWRKKTQQVDRLSAQVIRLTPEFWALEDVDRSILNVVLTYTHSPDNMPRGSTHQRGRLLLDQTRICDGVNTRHEQHDVEKASESPKIINAIREKIEGVLADLNINQALDDRAHADGWAQPANGFVLVQTARLRDHIKGTLDLPIQRAISLNANPTGAAIHPATRALYNALVAEDLIISEWKGNRPALGQFEAKIGAHTFVGLFILDLAKLADRMPDKVSEWGRARLPVHIKTARAKPADKSAN